MKEPSSSRAGSDTDRRLAEVVADAVIAAYVHEISDRHGKQAPGDDRVGHESSSE